MFKKQNYYTDKKNDPENLFYVTSQKFSNRRLLRTEYINKYDNDVIYRDNFYKNTETINDILDYESDSETGYKNENAINDRYSSMYTNIKDYTYSWTDNGLYKYEKKYIPAMFGRLPSGRDFCIHVHNYQPWFLIRVPDAYASDKDGTMAFHKLVKNNIEKRYLFSKNKLHYNSSSRDGFFYKFKLKKYRDSIQDIKIVYGKPYDEYTGDDIFPFIKLSFDNSSARNFFATNIFGSNKQGDSTKIYFKFKNRLYPIDIKLYEDGINPNTRFFHERKLKPVGWYNLKKYKNIPENEKLTNCAIEFAVDYNDLVMEDETDRLITPNLIGNAFDIETSKIKYSKINNAGEDKFPRYQNNDPIICIGNVLNIGDKQIKISLTLNKVSDTNPEKNTHIIEFDEHIDIYENEKEMLMYWINLNRHMSTDIYLTYNGHKYDWDYIYNRCVYHNIDVELLKMTKYHNEKTTFNEYKTHSSGAGNNFTKKMRVFGAWDLDLYKYYNGLANKSDFPNLTLKCVSQIIIGETKEDLDYEKLFEYASDCFENSDSDASKKKNDIINSYCLQDCNLLFQLNDVSSIMLNLISKSNISSLDLQKCADSSQGTPLVSIISNFAMTGMGDEIYFMPKFKQDVSILEELWTKKLNNDPVYKQEYMLKNETRQIKAHDDFIKSYTAKGGAVAVPAKGQHDCVGTMDVKSMYPSTMIENNLCKTRTILQEKYRVKGKYTRYYYTLKNGEKRYADIAINPTNHDKKLGVLPRVCQYLLNARKKIKDRMKSIKKLIPTLKDVEKIKFYKRKLKILDADQKAVKVLCNSVYGQTLATFSILYAPHVGGITTQEGRNYIHACDDLCCGTIITDISDIAHKFVRPAAKSLKYWLGDWTDPNNFEELEKIVSVQNLSFYKLFAENLINDKRTVRDKSNDKIYHWPGFVAGSKCIYGDTDSVFIKFPCDKKKKEERFYDAWDNGVKCEKDINIFFNILMKQPNMIIELEKIFSYLWLFSVKKRYYGYKHETCDYNKKTKMIRGVKGIKRDATKIERIFSRKIMEFMLSDRKELVLPYTKAFIKRIYKHQFDNTYFYKSAKFKGFDAYKETSIDRVGHVIAANMIKKRDPGRTPVQNERIYYTYKKTSYGCGKKGGIIKPKKMDMILPAIYITKDTSIDYKTFIEYMLSNEGEIIKYCAGWDDNITVNDMLLTILKYFDINPFD